MGFTRSAAEIAQIRRTLSGVQFVGGESLSVDFLTDPAVVRGCLPPGLEPAEEPRMTAQVSRWRSNCVGDFYAAAVYVAATYDGVDADYVLTMFMDHDSPLLFGRDLYGEPKKIGTMGLFRNGDTMYGRLDRKGVRLIEIDARLGEDRGPAAAVGRNFNVKYELAPDGSGLVGAPTLMLAEFTSQVTLRRRGPATLTLGGSVHDPLHELPVLELREASYTELGMDATCRPLADLDAESFLPHAFGRMDFWPDLATDTLPVVAEQEGVLA